MSAFDSSVEICLLTVDECFVYKVPPLRTASGHRAEDWGLASPLFTGCMKLFQAGDALRLAIYSFKDPKKTNVTNENIQLFGECPIQVKAGETIIQFVDAVIDSSRYYVVKIKDPKSTRTTLLGIGFREREDAFDLKNCLNDYVKFVSRMDLASQLAAAPLTDDFSHQQQQQHRQRGPSSSEDGPVLGQVDHPDQEDQEEAHHHGGGSSGGYALSGSGSSQSDSGAASWSRIPALREGEKIKISLTTTARKEPHTATAAKSSSSSCGGSGGGGGLLLKPPPPPGSTVHFGGSTGDATAAAVTAAVPSVTSMEPPIATAAAASAEEGEEEWGDFN